MDLTNTKWDIVEFGPDVQTSIHEFFENGICVYYKGRLSYEAKWELVDNNVRIYTRSGSVTKVCKIEGSLLSGHARNISGNTWLVKGTLLTSTKIGFDATDKGAEMQIEVDQTVTSKVSHPKGSKWNIKEPGSSLGESIWEFLGDGVLKSTKKGLTTTHAYKFIYDQIIIYFNNSYTIYSVEKCKPDSSRLVGNAKNKKGLTWPVEGELIPSLSDDKLSAAKEKKGPVLGGLNPGTLLLFSPITIEAKTNPSVELNDIPSVSLNISFSSLAPVKSKTQASTLRKVQGHFEAQDIVQAEIIRRIKGGYEAQVLGREAFLPGSHSLVKGAVPVEEDPLIGTTIPVLILEIKYPLQLVVSHREAKAELAALEREAGEEARLALKQRQREELSTVCIGDVIEARVDHVSSKSVALHAGSLCVRVDCEEMSWGKSPQPPVPGTVIQVVITGRDEENSSLQASIRLLTPDPWLSVAERYPLGQTATALVKKVIGFGLFVELEPAVTALVHRSNMPGITPQTDLEDYFSQGDRIPIAVETIDEEARKMGALLTVSLREWSRLRPLQDELREAAHQATVASKQREVLEQQCADLQESNARLQQQHTEEYKHWQELIQAKQKECENLRALSNASAEQRQESEQAWRLQVSKAKVERDRATFKAQQTERGLQTAEQHAQRLQARSNLQEETLSTWRNKAAQLEQQVKDLEIKVATAQRALPVKQVVSDALPQNLEAHYHAVRTASFYEHSVKECHPYCCLLPYLPTRFEGTAEQQADRQYVFDFKDGRNTLDAAYRIAIALLRSFSPLELERFVFAVIPASTRAKNVLRFKSFCRHLCEMTGMANGFDLIAPIQDRETLKGNALANRVGNLRYDEGRIAGRSVMLFDDVMTYGTSFTQNASQLMGHGAIKVSGVFLARTMSTRDL